MRGVVHDENGYLLGGVAGHAGVFATADDLARFGQMMLRRGQLGGKRVLILLDASASMLDETIVNVIRRRNLEPAQRRSAPKWRRALASSEWLIANLPPDSRFQLYRFNTEAEIDRAAVELTAALREL